MSLRFTSVANIESNFTSIKFTDSTQPSIDQVNSWIDQAGAQIYGALSNLYVFPITNSDDLKQLEALADSFVIDKVKMVLAMNNGNQVPSSVYAKRFSDTLNLYITGKLILPNSTRADNALPTYSFNSSNNIVPVSSKESVAW